MGTKLKGKMSHETQHLSHYRVARNSRGSLVSRFDDFVRFTFGTVKYKISN